MTIITPTGILGINSITAQSGALNFYTVAGNNLPISAGTLNVGTGASISSPTTNVLALGTNNTEAIRVGAAGSVGIGTINPVAKLQVQNGYIKLENNLNGENTFYLRNTNTSGNGAYSVIRFTQSDDVGSSGNAYIHYFNSGYNSNGFWDANSLASGTTDGNVNFYVGGNNQFKVWTNAAQRFVITGAGNVGIGFTNPSTKLDVNGEISNSAGKIIQPVKVQSTMVNADANLRFVFDLPSTYTFYKITGRFRFEGAGATYRVWGDMVWDDGHTGNMEGFSNMWQNGPAVTFQDTIAGRYFEIADPVDASSFPVDFTVYVPTKSFNEGTRMGCWGEMRYTHSGVGNALSIFSYGDISASGTDTMTQFAWDIDVVGGSPINGKCIYIIEAYPFTL